MKKKFNFRGFLSLYIALSFLIMTLSGIVLYLSPAGRIANWSNWRLLGLLKSQWQAVHTIFTFIFVVAILFHLFFNWRPLIAYLRMKIGTAVLPRKEMLGASILALLIFIMTVNGITPFSSVMTFGESLKDSWSSTSSEPPIPHAEEQSIVKFAETIKVPTDKLIGQLSSKGIKVENESSTIKEISAQNNIAPSDIYKIVKETSDKPINVPAEGRGYGRKTIEQICTEQKISTDEGLNRLRAKGIKADKEEKLKDVAARNNLVPMDIANTITGAAN
ncbi:hypothetical protein C0389_06505 [bacterium]|nr:hypothetical protein [bacterium]